jgi:hypothetical protein
MAKAKGSYRIEYLCQGITPYWEKRNPRRFGTKKEAESYGKWLTNSKVQVVKTNDPVDSWWDDSFGFSYYELVRVKGVKTKRRKLFKVQLFNLCKPKGKRVTTSKPKA